jgi:trimethylamine--corrinoid protein Co-methyltransferase
MNAQDNHINSILASSCRLFTNAQLDEIHLAALEILRRTGVRVYYTEALELLHDAGCVIEDKTLVKFPASVVEDALLYAPSRIVLCDRTGEPRMYLEGNKTYFGTGSDLPNTIDLETRERRLSLLSDVENTARLVDYLPNLDFTMSMALPSDVPTKTSDRYSFLAMIKNTTKPIVFTAWDEAGLKDIIAMAQVVAGSIEQLALNPFLLAYLEPTSPLQHSQDAVRKLLLMAEYNLPVVYAPGAIEGASAPVTPAGSLAMSSAEALSGLVIAQLKCKGTPFVWGSGGGPLDMRTAVFSYGSPEFMLHCMGMAELGHYYYHLPVWGFSGCSDSKIPDIQAGIEDALWILWTAFSGANLVHDIGYIESGLTCSYEMIVICDEIISFVRKLLGGVNLSREMMALDVIHEVGPGGSYIETLHTLDHFDKVWYPRFFDRRAYGAWVEAGKPTAIKTANEIAREVISKHKASPLPISTLETLNDIIAEADSHLSQ